MDEDQTTEERADSLSPSRLDNLLRGLGTKVLRRKFKEIYAKLNDGKEWTDGPESGEEFCRSKWGNGAYVKGNSLQQEMMKGRNIELWDISCLQSVIIQMLTAARNDKPESINRKSWSKDPSDPSKRIKTIWDDQMSSIRRLTNIRNSVFHLPNETLPQEEFDEYWREAISAIRKLGATQEEIDKVSAIDNLPEQQQQVNQGHAEFVASKKRTDGNPEESKPAEELRTKFEELEVKTPVKGQLNTENVHPIEVNKKNESRATSLLKRGDSASKSRDWDKALEFYTRALEILDISDDLRRKIYINRSWAYLKILEVPKLPFNFDPSKSMIKKASKCSKGKLPGENPSTASKRDPKFMDEKLLETDRPKWPEKLTPKLREIHVTAGMADAESALQLSPEQKCPKAFYHLARFHQLKGDWKTALTYFDLALGQSDLDFQIESDRNACQLELLNQTEVEEFNWIPGKKNQTMAGLPILRNTWKWGEIMDNAPNNHQQLLYSQVIRAHFMAQSHALDNEATEQPVTVWPFEEVAKLYERVGMEGFASGIYNLGLFLQEGHGVSQADFFGAVYFFKSAALVPIDDTTPDWKKEGVLEAQYRLGLCYEFGLGVGKNDKKALHWYEMASEGDYGRASRRLGDIYFQGRLGVSKDEDMAIFCWEQAASRGGDTVAQTSAALHALLRPSVTWGSIVYSLYNFSSAIFHNYESGTPTMITAVLNRKRHLESTLATRLHELSQANSTEGEIFLSENENEREPEEVSWNIPAFTNHILRTIHLLELAQTPEFLQKLEATPNWREQFIYTDRLVQASNSCMKGLAAFQDLNKLYRLAVVESTGGQQDTEVDYPPDFGPMDETTMVVVGHLTTVILDSFANSIRLVGAANFRDRLTQELIKSFIDKICDNLQTPQTRQQRTIANNSFLISSYILILRGVDLQELDRIFGPAAVNASKELFIAISTAAVQGSLGKFDVAAEDLEWYIKKLADDKNPKFFAKIDLLFVRALCLKSVALTRGVNSANRKKIKEAISILEKFLLVCPKDDPRRAETHYQLALCTLYLEKMKVKGQAKGQSLVVSSPAKDILDKVMVHFTQGEEAEQDVPWKEFQCPDDFPVKLLLQREIREHLAKNNPVQNSTSDLGTKSSKLESSWFGGLMDPFLKFPASSFPLKMAGPRRIEVITQYRKFFRAAMERGLGSSSYSAWSLSIQMEELKQLYFLPGNTFSAQDATCGSILVGCYEIVEPVMHSWIPMSSRCKDHEPQNLIMAFTVVQDESGAVFCVQLVIKLRGDEGEDKVGEIGEFRMGARIIINRPGIRLHADGGTSLMVNDVDVQVFHLPTISTQQEEGRGEEDSEVTRKCGYCGQIGRNLEQCAKCTVVYYCDKDCQTADWKDLKHKWICPFLHPSYSPPSPVQEIRYY